MTAAAWQRRAAWLAALPAIALATGCGGLAARAERALDAGRDDRAAVLVGRADAAIPRAAAVAARLALRAEDVDGARRVLEAARPSDDPLLLPLRIEVATLRRDAVAWMSAARDGHAAAVAVPLPHDAAFGAAAFDALLDVGLEGALQALRDSAPLTPALRAQVVQRLDVYLYDLGRRTLGAATPAAVAALGQVLGELPIAPKHLVAAALARSRPGAVEALDALTGGDADATGAFADEFRARGLNLAASRAYERAATLDPARAPAWLRDAAAAAYAANEFDAARDHLDASLAAAAGQGAAEAAEALLLTIAVAEAAPDPRAAQRLVEALGTVGCGLPGDVALRALRAQLAVIFVPRRGGSGDRDGALARGQQLAEARIADGCDAGGVALAAGAWFMERGEPDRAVAWLVAAIEAAPSVDALRQLHGAVRARAAAAAPPAAAGSPPAATPALPAASSSAPTATPVAVAPVEDDEALLARALDATVAAYAAAPAVAPDETLLALADVATSLGRPGAVVALLQARAAASPASIEVAVACATARRAAGDPDWADSIAAATRAAPDRVAALQRVALWYEASGMPDDAAAAWLQAADEPDARGRGVDAWRRDDRARALFAALRLSTGDAARAVADRLALDADSARVDWAEVWASAALVDAPVSWELDLADRSIAAGYAPTEVLIRRAAAREGVGQPVVAAEEIAAFVAANPTRATEVALGCADRPVLLRALHAAALATDDPRIEVALYTCLGEESGRPRIRLNAQGVAEAPRHTAAWEADPDVEAMPLAALRRYLREGGDPSAFPRRSRLRPVGLLLAEARVAAAPDDAEVVADALVAAATNVWGARLPAWYVDAALRHTGSFAGDDLVAVSRSLQFAGEHCAAIEVLAAARGAERGGAAMHVDSMLAEALLECPQPRLRAALEQELRLDLAALDAAGDGDTPIPARYRARGSDYDARDIAAMVRATLSDLAESDGRIAEAWALRLAAFATTVDREAFDVWANRLDAADDVTVALDALAGAPLDVLGRLAAIVDGVLGPEQAVRVWALAAEQSDDARVGQALALIDAGEAEAALDLVLTHDAAALRSAWAVEVSGALVGAGRRDLVVALDEQPHRPRGGIDATAARLELGLIDVGRALRTLSASGEALAVAVALDAGLYAEAFGAWQELTRTASTRDATALLDERAGDLAEHATPPVARAIVGAPVHANERRQSAVDVWAGALAERGRAADALAVYAEADALALRVRPPASSRSGPSFGGADHDTVARRASLRLLAGETVTPSLVAHAPRSSASLGAVDPTPHSPGDAAQDPLSDPQFGAHVPGVLTAAEQVALFVAAGRAPALLDALADAACPRAAVVPPVERGARWPDAGLVVLARAGYAAEAEAYAASRGDVVGCDSAWLVAAQIAAGRGDTAAAAAYRARWYAVTASPDPSPCGGFCGDPPAERAADADEDAPRASLADDLAARAALRPSAETCTALAVALEADGRAAEFATLVPRCTRTFDDVAAAERVFAHVDAGQLSTAAALAGALAGSPAPLARAAVFVASRVPPADGAAPTVATEVELAAAAAWPRSVRAQALRRLVTIDCEAAAAVVRTPRDAAERAFAVRAAACLGDADGAAAALRDWLADSPTLAADGPAVIAALAEAGMEAAAFDVADRVLRTLPPGALAAAELRFTSAPAIVAAFEAVPALGVRYIDERVPHFLGAARPLYIVDGVATLLVRGASLDRAMRFAAEAWGPSPGWIAPLGMPLSVRPAFAAALRHSGAAERDVAAWLDAAAARDPEGAGD